MIPFVHNSHVELKVMEEMHTDMHPLDVKHPLG